MGHGIGSCGIKICYSQIFFDIPFVRSSIVVFSNLLEIYNNKLRLTTVNKGLWIKNNLNFMGHCVSRRDDPGSIPGDTENESFLNRNIFIRQYISNIYSVRSLDYSL